VDLLERLEGRPLEQGLLAWDALSGSLVDGDFRRRLQAHAAAVRDALPPPGRRGVPLQSLATVEVVASVAAASYRGADDDRLLDGIGDHALGAYEAFRAQNPKDVGLLSDEDDLIGSTLAFARLLHLGQLTALASFYAAYLWRAFGDERGLGDACEALLDVRAWDLLPSLPEGLNERNRPLVEYVGYRQLLAAGRPIDAKASFETMKELGLSVVSATERSRERDGIELALAHVALYFRAPVARQPLEEIVHRHPLWRYANLMRTSIALRDGDEEQAREALHGFVETFGNDEWVWNEAFVRQDRAPFVALLAREASRLPHDLRAWSALADLPGIRDPSVQTELQARIAAQSTLDRA
jgi:hypothetical protein